MPCYPGSESWHGSFLMPAMCREPLCSLKVVTSCAVMYSITSESITPPSSLILAHAPDQIPPAAFDSTIATGLCHAMALSPVPAGRWPFPSPPQRDNPCVGAWTPIPQCPSSALARFFPEDNGLTANVTGSAHRKYSLQCNFNRVLLLGAAVIL
jgi:hypothetical protein